MELLQNLALGFSTALAFDRLLACLIGVVIGTLVGVLPGIGPAAAISLLLPSTFHLDPTSGVIMLAGIYYGAMYGGSTTSILVNIPGEAASVVTCLDGYQMARNGRAGPALGISAMGSFIAGTLSVIGLMLVAPPLARFALSFGPPEYFALIFCGLAILIYLASGSILKAVIMALAGLFLGMVGTDLITGNVRFTFGNITLMDGIGMVPVVMGLFGIAEVLDNLEKSLQERAIFQTSFANLLPNRKDWSRSIGPILRGSFVGFFLGILPGGGAIISSFTSYALEKRLSRHPEEFGKGAIEGVAGPESANNAASSGAFIPLLTLGMAIVLGALLTHGIQPGPLLLVRNADLFWGVVTSMYLGNAMLLVLNLPLIGLWVRLLKIPYSILFPLILLFCLIGAYSVNNNSEEVVIMILFGVIGYLMRKFDYEAAPLIFALVLSPLFENALRQSLLMSNGSFTIFFTRPISLSFMVIGIALFLLPMLPFVKRKVVKDEL
ncbi:MAG: tripartite tricarboxylate transporter permease [Deltaproteobacteria bacterium]|nr:tripartite tricarboxylate transporter permease [Deltaproteobacteria bacterium]